MSFIQKKEFNEIIKNLNKDGFKNYLVSKNFKDLLQNLNLQDLWKSTEDYINNVSFLLFSFRGKTELSDQIFGVFIENLYNSNKKDFLKYFIEIIKDFFKFKNKELTSSYIEKLLKPLNFSYEEIQNHLN
jgi:hypothetical protein